MSEHVLWESVELLLRSQCHDFLQGFIIGTKLKKSCISILFPYSVCPVLVIFCLIFFSPAPALKEPACENTQTCESKDDEGELSTEKGVDVEQNQGPLSHIHSSEFSAELQSSPAGGGCPLDTNTDKPERGKRRS